MEFLASTVGKSMVDAWLQSSSVDDLLSKLREALPKAGLLIERSECWRLPKYKPIDELLPLLKDAIYEAQIVVDEFEYQGFKYKAEKNILPGEYFHNYFTNWMSSFPITVKRAHGRLDYIYQQMQKACDSLGIPENPNQCSERAAPVKRKLVDRSVVYGRDNELKDVMSLLGIPGYESDCRKRVKNENMSDLAIIETNSSMAKKGNVSVISIVGAGGVGKTTLAQMVYDDKSVNCYFDTVMWVCTSGICDVTRLTKEIIESATKSRCNRIYLDYLQVTLKQTLVSKKFLLILDGSWSESEKDWQILLEPMKEGSEGSAIIVTTRSQKVANIVGKSMESIVHLHLEVLEKNIYWDFFKGCSFDSDQVNAESYPELEKIGKRISEKLEGSPLAAKTIGGLLNTNLEMGHWSSIKDSKVWELKQDVHDIFPVLQLSYQYLPSYLKKCFSFCALYPKGYKFRKSKLKKFWIMRGFIDSREKSQEDIQDLADSYFYELERRGFFQKAAGCSYQRFVIHDLLHDLCQFVTKDECVFLEDENFAQKIPPDTRHVSVSQERFTQDRETELCIYKKLLSLSVLYPRNCYSSTIELSNCYSIAIDNWCNELSNIRSLSLVNCNIRMLPESIGNLKYLQYLDISWTGIEMLPESFCSLYNLQYLSMEGCWNIRTFPKESNKLVNLRLFYFPSYGFPLEGPVSNLAKVIVVKNLEISIRQCGENIERIENLKHICIRGSLTIHGVQDVPSKEAAEEAQLNDKPLINSLVLNWGQFWGCSVDRSVSSQNQDEEILQGLRPHPNLKVLKIIQYRGCNLSPGWINEEFLPSLTELHIKDCMNVCTISHLPRFITKLSISNCPKLVFVPAEVTNNLKSLTEMHVENCAKLRSLGGLRFLASLQQLCIQYCPKLEETKGQRICGKLPSELLEKNLPSSSKGRKRRTRN